MRYTATEITAIRKSLFLTQVQFKDLLGVQLTILRNWEQSKYRPSQKWCDRIREKLDEIRKRLTILNIIYREKTELYFVLFDSDLVDYAAKQILYSQKIRSGFECYLVTFNRKSYENYTQLDRLSPKPLNNWAKWYHKHGEKKPVKRKKEYVWLSEWEA